MDDNKEQTKSRKGIRRFFRRFLCWLDDLFFPEDVACLCCERALMSEDREYLCSECREKLHELAEEQRKREEEGKISLPEGVEAVNACWTYEAQAKLLVRGLKFDKIRACAVPMAAAMCMLPLGEATLLVPVPTDPKRELRRGFNQSRLLAERMAEETGMPCVDAIRRIRPSLPQSSLSGSKRKANVEGCMRASVIVRGESVLLIDDVYTTGSTAAEAARALREAGAQHVSVCCCAMAKEKRRRARS